MKTGSRNLHLRVLCCVLVVVAIAGCSSNTPRPGTIYERGQASYYGADFAGRKTANGERFNPRDLTAAHKKLPFGTRVRVTNTDNGKGVIVRINDRGPFVRGRIIDLSQGAASQLDMIKTGVAPVTIEVLP